MRYLWFQPVLWIRTHFFRIRIHNCFFEFGFGSFYLLIFWPEIFWNGASHLLCVLESVRQRKKFANWKTYVFLFQVFDLRFFTIFLQQCLDPNPNLNPNFFRIWIRIQPKYSDSFGFRFWFGSSQNIRILSDSDPQHWFHPCNRSKLAKINATMLWCQENYALSVKHFLSLDCNNVILPRKLSTQCSKLTLFSIKSTTSALIYSWLCSLYRGVYYRDRNTGVSISRLPPFYNTVVPVLTCMLKVALKYRATDQVVGTGRNEEGGAARFI
jgi:hypothetical protein